MYYCLPPNMMEIPEEKINLIAACRHWMVNKNWTPQKFQEVAWEALFSRSNGLVNAPTGSGKTYSLMLPAIIAMNSGKPQKGCKLIWITPIRALAKEIKQSAERVIQDLEINLKVGIRSGDTGEQERAAQRKELPDILITTPESLHLLLALKDASKLLSALNWCVVDEWHDLIGTKRGVMMELALSRLRGMNNQLSVWAISATIGNLEEAATVLIGHELFPQAKIIKAEIEKRIEVVSLMPDEVEKMPWAGHLGIKMIDKVLEIIKSSKSTLIFTNTRAQCEIWYRNLLESDISLSGEMAMHHGSLAKDLRHWVEDAISDGRLKVVVCTSSLDLGVDFAPVETIIQIGGPKGIARFLQRAGRSGHRPDAISKIYFLPTHSLELVEAAALREAVRQKFVEEKTPMIRCFDVLVQYLTTLAVGEGFDPNVIYQEVQSTHCFHTMSKEEWNWIIFFTATGGTSLNAYPDYRKFDFKDGLYKIVSPRLARRHRLSIGTIVGDTMMMVKYQRGGLIGHVEESFIAALNEGDKFWFAGIGLELIRVKELTAFVKKTDKMTGKIPSWQGGRLPLSSKMSHMIRLKLNESVSTKNFIDPELEKVQPIIELQQQRSRVPLMDEFLIEVFESKDGHHAVFYPFEGRFVHEGLASLFAYRIGQLFPISFSLAYNDYGFELLSDQPIPLEEALGSALTDELNLEIDVINGVNSAELAKRKFRDIATISGLVFRGFPGQPIKDRHLQTSSSLIFKVFEEYDSQNLLYKQSYEEVLLFQLEMPRLRYALQRINKQKIIVNYPQKPTPFAFPIMVDRLREKMTSETLEDRIAKMTLDFQ